MRTGGGGWRTGLYRDDRSVASSRISHFPNHAGGTGDLSHNVVLLAMVDDRFDHGVTMFGHDREQGRVTAQPFVVSQLDEELFDTFAISALAQDLEPVRRFALLAHDRSDLFVNLAEERLVSPNPGGTIRHPQDAIAQRSDPLDRLRLSVRRDARPHRLRDPPCGQ